MNVPVNGTLMKLKATALAREIEMLIGKPQTDGCIASKKKEKRHGPAFKIVCGESASVTPEMVKNDIRKHYLNLWSGTIHQISSLWTRQDSSINVYPIRHSCSVDSLHQGQ